MLRLQNNSDVDNGKKNYTSCRGKTWLPAQAIPESVRTLQVEVGKFTSLGLGQ